ncbi:hypothetical protein AB1I68_27910 [Paenibacillus pabuli]
MTAKLTLNYTNGDFIEKIDTDDIEILCFIGGEATAQEEKNNPG